MEKIKKPWTYTLHGGPLDGATGHCLEIRAAVTRPSTEDLERLYVYRLTHTSGTDRHLTYRFSYIGYKRAIAT